MIALNNFTCGNLYTNASTREQRLTVKVNITVLNAACFLQCCDDQGNFSAFDEEFLPPGGYSLIRRCGGARVRNGAAGQNSQVSMTLLTKADT